MIRTKIDEIIDLIQKSKKKIVFSDIAKKLSWDENTVEKIILILEKNDLVETHYPLDMIRKPWATLKKQPEKPVKKESKEAKGKAMEKYEITGSANHLNGVVKIVYSNIEKRPIYYVTVPEISQYTRAYLEYVKTVVSRSLSLEIIEKGKEETEKHFNKRRDVIQRVIKKDIDPDPASLKAITGIVLKEMFGLKELEALIGDQRLEEIVINTSKTPVAVYHRKFGWLKTNVYVENELETENYAAQIARKVGRQISLLNPILDARLNTGDRTNATLFPISSHGNTITLRLFSKNPWTIVTYLKEKSRTMSPEMAAMLWQAMQYEMNIVIAGGTASGKTSALNGLLALVQPFQRIVTIEDTQELSLPTYQWNWVPLVTRPPNPEGFGEVTMLDLVVNALRMRPDRIIMGEIRRKREAEVLFEAMHTGHSVYATLHADTGMQVIKRLTEPPIEIPEAEVEDIHLLLIQYRDRRKNIRRTLELSEIVPGQRGPELNRIFTWKARNDTFDMVKSARRYNEQMNLHTGMTEREIKADQGDKVKVLNWMVKNDLDKVDDVGRVMKAYYADPQEIIKAAGKGTSPSKVLVE